MMAEAGHGVSRKRAAEEAEAMSDVSEGEMEEQLCAQAAEALNQFLHLHNCAASVRSLTP
jgi:hypothetical protein